MVEHTETRRRRGKIAKAIMDVAGEEIMTSHLALKCADVIDAFYAPVQLHELSDEEWADFTEPFKKPPTPALIKLMRDHRDSQTKKDETATTAQIAALEGALEWALAHCRDSEHPHYPYFSDDAWRFPYLVNNDGGSGGGVGEARFDTALEAVQDAIRRAALASTDSMKGEVSNG